jgi:hypothetical protein
MIDKMDLIQPCQHLILRQWLEVRRFEIETTGGQCSADVLRDQLLV